MQVVFVAGFVVHIVNFDWISLHPMTTSFSPYTGSLVDVTGVAAWIACFVITKFTSSTVSTEHWVPLSRSTYWYTLNQSSWTSIILCSNKGEKLCTEVWTGSRTGTPALLGRHSNHWAFQANTHGQYFLNHFISPSLKFLRLWDIHLIIFAPGTTFTCKSIGGQRHQMQQKKRNVWLDRESNPGLQHY